MDYDKAFRQQLATGPSAECRQPQPASVHYAWASVIRLTPLLYTLPGSRPHMHSVCTCLFRAPPPPPPPPLPATTQCGPVSAWRKPPFSPTCFAWNRGTCPYAGRCNYRHVCSTCSAYSHKAPDCPQAAVTSARPAEHPSPHQP